MARYWIIVVVTASGFFFLAGCGQGPPIQPDEAGDARPKTTEATAEQTEPQASFPEPPNGTLVFGDQREAGELGGYCWDGVCTEANFVVPPEGEALAVPSGSDLLFEYGGEHPPSKVEAKAYTLVGGKAEGPGKSLPVPRAGARIRIPAEVPPGEYVVELSVEVPEGSAFYYFRVAAEGDAGELPDSGGPGVQGPEDQ